MTTEASDSPFAPAAAEPPSTTERLQETTQVALEVLAQKAAEAGHLVKKVMGILPVKEEDGEEDGYTPSLLRRRTVRTEYILCSIQLETHGENAFSFHFTDTDTYYSHTFLISLSCYIQTKRLNTKTSTAITTRRFLSFARNNSI
jgi:hypothetical protein